MAPRLVALSQNTQYAILRVDIARWGSAVAKQYDIHSVPHLKVFDASGKLVAEGKEAYRYLK